MIEHVPAVDVGDALGHTHVEHDRVPLAERDNSGGDSEGAALSESCLIVEDNPQPGLFGTVETARMRVQAPWFALVVVTSRMLCDLCVSWEILTRKVL